MESDWVDTSYFFRTREAMPELETKALDLAKGKILDVGSGSGCHTLELLKQGKDVHSLEISPNACKAQQEQGIPTVFNEDIMAFSTDTPYDTILLLMNGIGVCGTIEKLPELLEHLATLLAPGGSILFDSSDLIYLFQEEDGSVWVDLNGKYYGEVNFQVEYKGIVGESFPWTYIDPKTMEMVAEQTGFDMEIVQAGEHYDYLAKLTRKG